MDKYLERHSARSFKNQAIPLETIKQFQTIISTVPSSFNGQCFSAIFVTDQSLKAKISVLNWNQQHIKQAPLIVIFVADMRRPKIAGEKSGIDLTSWIESPEGFLTGIVDATIGATTLVNYATQMGFGTCFIGGIRMYAEKLVEALDLPKYVLPVVGVLVGYEDKVFDPKIKPKVNKVFFEKYDEKTFENDLEAYTKTMVEYFDKRRSHDPSISQGHDYYKNTAKAIGEVIKHDRYGTLLPTIEKQKLLKRK